MKAVVVLLLVSCIGWTLAARSDGVPRCYQCRSAVDRDCPPDGPVQAKWARECDPGVVGCTKITAENGDVERVCGNPQHLKMPGTARRAGVGFVTYCTGAELCNA
ncbi:uncharacterized protein LOC129601288 [Paramacrobiotus metropolitanus]|uniref:uncharacterized protein LOC129601288 n=1 Tax=Paramacrobiotus metropolitanus TaxID=2943436 RepID=UPI002445A339|nr:uncharacterized protein LOC129601288 [Paramacrobiotus metropolitanus]